MREETTPRVEYRLGEPEYADGGWRWDTTSTGWTRQAPVVGRVAFAPDVALARGWATVKAEIAPRDPVLWGGQRAQLYTTESALRERQQAPLMTERGSYAWYGFVFKTNSTYVPQRALPYPNWNGVFSWHDSGLDCGGAHCWAPQANIAISVATAAPNRWGWRFFRRPRLAVEVYGGDPHDKDWWHHGRRWYTVKFIPGRRYVVQMGVRWGDSNNGSIEVWINGRRVVYGSQLSDLWQGSGVYPVFENYRQPTAPDAALGANTLYYAGLVRGIRRSQVWIPTP